MFYFLLSNFYLLNGFGFFCCVAASFVYAGSGYGGFGARFRRGIVAGAIDCVWDGSFRTVGCGGGAGIFGVAHIVVVTR
ncbi:MAG: hypothetical protein ACJ8M1_04955 [Chthoniobacterales bacterium]